MKIICISPVTELRTCCVLSLMLKYFGDIKVIHRITRKEHKIHKRMNEES